jgi:hypothetical protein
MHFGCTSEIYDSLTFNATRIINLGAQFNIKFDNTPTRNAFLSFCNGVNNDRPIIRVQGAGYDFTFTVQGAGAVSSTGAMSLHNIAPYKLLPCYILPSPFITQTLLDTIIGQVSGAFVVTAFYVRNRYIANTIYPVIGTGVVNSFTPVVPPAVLNINTNNLLVYPYILAQNAAAQNTEVQMSNSDGCNYTETLTIQ